MRLNRIRMTKESVRVSPQAPSLTLGSSLHWCYFVWSYSPFWERTKMCVQKPGTACVNSSGDCLLQLQACV